MTLSSGEVTFRFAPGIGPTEDMDSCFLFIRANKTNDDEVLLRYEVTQGPSTSILTDGGGWEPDEGMGAPTIFYDTTGLAGGLTTNVGRDADNHWQSVLVVPSGNQRVTQIEISADEVGSIAGGSQWWVEIWDDDSNTPGSVIANGVSSSLDPSAWGSGMALRTFTFPTPPMLTGSSRYYFVIKFSHTVSTSNYARAQRNASGGVRWRIASNGTETSFNDAIICRITSQMAGAPSELKVPLVTQVTDWSDVRLTMSIDNEDDGDGTIEVFDAWLWYPSLGEVVALTGDLDSDGAVSLVPATSVIGELESVGAVSSEAAVTATGSIEPEGSVSSLVFTTLEGLLETAGDLAAQAVIGLVEELLEGALELAGTVTLLAHNVASGALSSVSGALLRAVEQMLGGSVAPQPAQTRDVSTTYSGEVEPEGTVAPFLLTVGDTNIRFALSGGEDASTSTMNFAWLHIRHGVADVGNDELMVTIRIYQGATLLGTLEAVTDQALVETSWNLGDESIDQVTDWSDVELELEASIVDGGGGAVYVYDVWVRTYSTQAATFTTLQSTLMFGDTGGWPSWDSAWDGPHQDTRLIKQANLQPVGMLAPDSRRIWSSDLLEGIVTFLSTVATRWMIRRVPSGMVIPDDKPDRVVPDDKPDRVIIGR